MHLERELAAGFAARVGYVFKREANQFSAGEHRASGDRSTTSRLRSPILAETAPPVRPTMVGNDHLLRLRSRLSGHSVREVDLHQLLRLHRSLQQPGVRHRQAHVEQLAGAGVVSRNQEERLGCRVPVRRPARSRSRRTRAPFPKNQTWETTFRVSGSYRARTTSSRRRSSNIRAARRSRARRCSGPGSGS